MAERLSGWLYRVSSGWVALAATALFVAFLVGVLPRQAAAAEAATGGAGSPDGSFVYGTADLYRFAAEYGEQGRRAYVRARFTFDVVWPLAYTAFLATTISWLVRWAGEAKGRWRLANLSPVVGALFDFAENLSTSLVMARFPARTPVVDVLAPIFTLVKWIFVNGSFVLLLVGVVLGVWNWRKSQKRS